MPSILLSPRRQQSGGIGFKFINKQNETYYRMPTAFPALVPLSGARALRTIEATCAISFLRPEHASLYSY